MRARDDADAHAGASRSSPQRAVPGWPARPGWRVPHPGALAGAARSGSRPCPAPQVGSSVPLAAAHQAGPNGLPAPTHHARPDRPGEPDPWRETPDRPAPNGLPAPTPHASLDRSGEPDPWQEAPDRPEANRLPAPNRRAEPTHRAEPGLRGEPNHRVEPIRPAEPGGRMGLNRQAAPRAPPVPAARPALLTAPGQPRERSCPGRPRLLRRRDQVLDRLRGRACRIGRAPGRGLRSGRPGRHHRPAPSPGSRCGRGTRSAPERQFSRPRGLPRPGWAPSARPGHARENHCGASGPDRAPGQGPGRAQVSHHSGQAGDRGRHKSHAARQAPHEVARPAGPAPRQMLAAHNPAGGHRARTRSPGPHRLARGLSLPARAQRHARVPDRPAPGPAHRRDPDPARDHAVRAEGRPGNYARSRRGPLPVPDPGLPRPARRAGRSRTPRLGRPGARDGESRGPVNRYVRNRIPRLPRVSPGCLAGPDSPGRPANPPGPPACAGLAPSRGTAAPGTHARAGRRGTQVRDRRSHAPAARAAVPAGSRRSFVPLPCQ